MAGTIPLPAAVAVVFFPVGCNTCLNQGPPVPAGSRRNRMPSRPVIISQSAGFTSLLLTTSLSSFSFSRCKVRVPSQKAAISGCPRVQGDKAIDKARHGGSDLSSAVVRHRLRDLPACPSAAVRCRCRTRPGRSSCPAIPLPACAMHRRRPATHQLCTCRDAACPFPAQHGLPWCAGWPV